MPAYIVLDTQDPEPLIEFWTKIQDVEVLLSYDDGRYTALGPNREGLMVVLQRVPEAKVGKNRAHFDLAPPADGDQQAEVERLVSLGATRVDIGQGEVSWVVMADPDGHEFCVLTPEQL